ncbi:MAG: DUF1343 domain-containing protein [Candidatus Sumerlaeia bacterium]
MIRTGLQVLLDRGFAPLAGLKVGVLTNPSAVDEDYRHLIGLMRDAGVRVQVLFSPEHGLFSTAQDMVPMNGVEVAGQEIRQISLYGESFDSLRPRPEDLGGLDVLVFDIQDVGCRTYTYVWTLALAMGTALKTRTPVVVLDRPNPITGAIVEGGGMEPRLKSFVGLYEVPNRHGMTAGEIATLVARRLEFDLLEVVRLEGWRRDMWMEETGAPWVMPSPNMPTPQTALVFPGACMVEGTNLSEGRGTTRPFEIIGAPFVDGERLAAALNEEGLPGVRFRSLRFQPMFQKWAGQICGGIQIHVTDRREFLSVRTGLAVLRHARALWPREFRWRTERYEFRDDVPAIDLLTGQARVREMIDAGAPVSEITSYLESTGGAARRMREDSLLYD